MIKRPKLTDKIRELYSAMGGQVDDEAYTDQQMRMNEYNTGRISDVN